MARGRAPPDLTADLLRSGPSPSPTKAQAPSVVSPKIALTLSSERFPTGGGGRRRTVTIGPPLSSPPPSKVRPLELPSVMRGARRANRRTGKKNKGDRQAAVSGGGNVAPRQDPPKHTPPHHAIDAAGSPTLPHCLSFMAEAQPDAPANVPAATPADAPTSAQPAGPAIEVDDHDRVGACSMLQKRPTNMG